MSPVPIEDDIESLEFTNPISVSTTMFIQSYDPRPSPVDTLLQAMLVYDWSLWLIIFLLLIIVSLVYHKIRSLAMNENLRRKKRSGRVKKLFKTMAKVFLTLIDRPSFESRNIHDLTLLATLLITMLIITRISLNLIGTQMVRSDLKFYTKLSDLDQSSPDDISIYWLSNGYALQYFQNPHHVVANRIFKSREHLDCIKGAGLGMLDTKTSEKSLYIEEDIFYKHLIPVFCRGLNLPLKVTYVKELETQFAVAFNERLNATVKAVIRKS